MREINKNAKLLFSGRVTSTVGDSIYQVAVIWHIFHLTHSSFFTGLAVAFTMVPKVLHFLVAPWVEYHHRQKVLKNAQLVQFILMLIIPSAIYFGFDNVWIILIVIASVSFVGNIEGTAEISIVPVLIEEEGLPKYNSLISTAQSMVDLSMKGLFGLAILYMSVGYIYLFNAVTFLIAALLFTYINHHFKNQRTKDFNLYNYKTDLADGFRQLLSPTILFICLPFLTANFSSGITTSILPAFAAQKADLNAYGLYLLSISIGSLLGSMVSYKLSNVPLKKLMTILPLCSFIVWAGAVFTNIDVLSIALLGIANIPVGVINVYFISYLQKTISTDMLGRVSAIIDSFLVATIPIGAVLAGVAASVIPVNIMMLIASGGMLFIALYFLLVDLEKQKMKQEAS